MTYMFNFLFQVLSFKFVAQSLLRQFAIARVPKFAQSYTEVFFISGFKFQIDF